MKTFASSFVAFAALLTLARSAEPLWLSDQPVPKAAELGELKGVQFHVIKAIEPEKDGYKWQHDERGGVSYPGGVEDKEGLIWIVYDRDRGGAGEIPLANFREEDVAAGKNVSGKVRLKQTINKLDKSMLLPPGWNAKQAADKVMARLGQHLRPAGEA
jgi:hypothetical protein